MRREAARRQWVLRREAAWMASETQMPTSCGGGPTGGHRQAAVCDDGQPDLPGGGHTELPGSGQRDYLV
jgi:hypothetical protein